jgi:hypothetical protein
MPILGIWSGNALIHGDPEIRNRRRPLGTPPAVSIVPCDQAVRSRRRRNIEPMPPKPVISIAQLDGSGTAPAP